MKTIGVTGGTGFIGQHIAKLARGLGYEVILFDHSKRLPPPTLPSQMILNYFLVTSEIKLLLLNLPRTSTE